MGKRHPRPQPARLASKLRTIRELLGFTLEEMAAALATVKKSPPTRSHIYRFEHGEREPSLLVLLAYSRIAGVTLETLADDQLKLPNKIKRRK